MGPESFNQKSKPLYTIIAVDFQPRAWSQISPNLVSLKKKDPQLFADSQREGTGIRRSSKFEDVEGTLE